MKIFLISTSEEKRYHRKKVNKATTEKLIDKNLSKDGHEKNRSRFK